VGQRLSASLAMGFEQANGDSLISSCSTNQILRGEYRVSGRDQHRRDELGSELDSHVSESAGDNRWQFASRPNPVPCRHADG